MVVVMVTPTAVYFQFYFKFRTHKNDYYSIGLGEGPAFTEGIGPRLRRAAVRLRQADGGPEDASKVLPVDPPPAQAGARVLQGGLLGHFLSHISQGKEYHKAWYYFNLYKNKLNNKLE